MSEIEPRCKSDFAQHFIHIDGYVMPCCWIGSYDSFQDYLRFFEDCANEMNLKNRKLSEILLDPRFLRIEESWKTNAPFKTCLEYCKKQSKSEISESSKKEDMFGNSTFKEVYYNKD